MSERLTWVYRVSRFLFWAFMRVWNRYSGVGMEYVPREGGCILAGNHASFLDPPILGCLVPYRMIRYLGRDTLFKNKFADWWARNVGVVQLDRTRGDLGALKTAIKLLKDGGALCLFPEGTRTSDGQLQKPKGGVGFMIAKAGVPVVPAYVQGTFQAYPRGAKWIRPCKVTVYYGEPIMPAELAPYCTDRDGYDKVAELVMTRIAALKANAETGLSA